MRGGVAARPDGRRAASEYLQQLLLKTGDYRRSWEQYVSRERRGTINQLAVAEVLARHLRESPRNPADCYISPHQLKDTVSRALTGRLLSRPALSLFIDSFGFSEHEAERLWRLWNGSVTIGVMTGTHAVPMHLEQDLAQALGPSRVTTVSMHDHVYVGMDRRIDRARIIQVLEATSPGVDRIPLVCDTSVLTVEVGQGGKELSDKVRQVGDDLFATEVLLATTLGIGETTSLEYWLTYRYPGFEEQSEREYRRGVIRHTDNLDMRVEFYPDCLPAKLLWARWDGGEGKILEEEEVTLDSQHSAHRYMRSLEKTVVGFYWEWD